MLLKRLLCTQAVARHRQRLHQNLQKWPIKQVTKSNFSQALAEIKTHISSSDFVAVSLQKTGSYTAPWQKLLPIDTEEVAYLKAKRAAERYQILQFAVCPFSVKESKLIAFPYNFHLFPRDELNIGLPSYSFSCQSSYLTSMAREGFDFNACIYKGISYLSRTQESAARVQLGYLSTNSFAMQSSSAHSVADSIFKERIKTRVKNWLTACKTSETEGGQDALIRSLRKIISGNEVYGSRPCLTIDVCSERQVMLAIEMLKEFVDIVPMRVPAKVGGVQAVRVILTSSEEDKKLLEMELQNVEEERDKCLRGFREVIDLISNSQKPVVAHNSLNDFAFIYSKFIAPLPMTIDEFKSSLFVVFPHVLDVNNIIKGIGPFEKINNLSATISFLKRRSLAPVDMEIPNRVSEQADEVNIHGHNVLRTCQLFAKLCSILKIAPEGHDGDRSQLPHSLCLHFNVFAPSSSSFRDSIDEDVAIWTRSSRRVGIDSLVFLWGFGVGISAGKLKSLLQDAHEIFSEEFDIRMVDKSCAVIVFWKAGFPQRFLRMMDSQTILPDKLKAMIANGLKAASYVTYKRVCSSSGLLKVDLAECLDEASEDSEIFHSAAETEQAQSVIYWNNEDMINLDDL